MLPETAVDRAESTKTNCRTGEEATLEEEGWQQDHRQAAVEAVQGPAADAAATAKLLLAGEYLPRVSLMAAAEGKAKLTYFTWAGPHNDNDTRSELGLLLKRTRF